MKVLSLFDGMRCGRIALERANVKVDTYYSSEIDKYAIQVADKNYPQDIENKLGDVTKWREWNIDWSKIDLLIGGSPCQGFSFAGKQLNFNDPRSKLFFEYADILNHIKKFNPNVKFLLENVSMKQEYQDVISQFLGVQPIEINSTLVSAQNRKRLYWTNIPNAKQPTDQNILLKDILDSSNSSKYELSEEYYQRFLQSKDNTRDKKFPTSGDIKVIGTTVNSIAKGTNSRHWVHDINSKAGCVSATDYKQPQQILDEYGVLRKLSPIEYERLQTLPDNYTNCVSDTQRYKMIGNGWTADVIAHILKGLLNT